jgi:putative membrane protein
MKRTVLAWVAAAAVVAVVAMTLTFAGCSKSEGTKAPAAEPPAVGTGGAGANLRGDDEFVRDVAMKNLAEEELSRMALGKSASADVRTFAQMMIDDHGAAGNDLKTRLSGQSIEWPAQLDEKHKKVADELAKEQGADFDRDYVKAMIDGHQDFAAKLESRLDVQSLADWKTAAAGRTQGKALPEPDAALRDVKVRPAASDNATTSRINQWAADTYPVAQKHLDTARTLENAAKKRSTD